MDKTDKKRLSQVAERARELEIMVNKLNGLTFVLNEAIIGYNLNNPKNKASYYGAGQLLTEMMNDVKDNIGLLTDELFSLLKTNNAR